MSDATFLMWIALPILVLGFVGAFLSLLVSCFEGRAWAAVSCVLQCLGTVVVVVRVAQIAGRI